MKAVDRCDGRRRPLVPGTIAGDAWRYEVFAGGIGPFFAGVAAGAKDRLPDGPGRIPARGHSQPATLGKKWPAGGHMFPGPAKYRQKEGIDGIPPGLAGVWFSGID